jgi:hypothetical protein
MTKIEERLKELENLDKAATPGPWEKQAYMNYIGWSLCAGNRGCVAERWYPSTVKDLPEGEEMAGNMNLIAAYRNETPKLIQALREAVSALNYVADHENIGRHVYSDTDPERARQTLTRIEALLTEGK